MLNLVKTWRGLKERGVMGINNRNAAHILKYNDRRNYPLVDNKIITKEKAIAAGINVPEKYAVISSEQGIKKLRNLVEHHSDFVIKPAQGAAGEGILVISDTFEGFYKTVSGRLVSYEELEYQISNILTGMYSLAGARDQALIEYRVTPDPVFRDISYEGVPDLRVIVLQGYPIMAMLRLPTRQSNGKANLHQGAIGVGINLATGITKNGSWINAIITKHPDTYNPVAGIQVPQWQTFLELAASCYEISKLGYIGVDLVLDIEKGPLMLELNARPGLNIQISNNAGLAKRVKQIEAHIASLDGATEEPQVRAQVSQRLFVE